MSEPSVRSSLLSETDRQLGEQRAQADAFATRSGLMVAATAVLSSVAAGLAGDGAKVSAAFLWAIGIGAVTGIIVMVMARPTTGPSTVQIASWGYSENKDIGLLTAKLYTIEANRAILMRTEVVLFLQAVATVLSLVLLAVENRG